MRYGSCAPWKDYEGVRPPTLPEATMPHALIIHNDPAVGAPLAEMIAAEGFSIAVAGSLAEARDRLGSIPDVVLLDLFLPDGNGIELLRELAPDTSTQVIVVTGNPSIE